MDQSIRNNDNYNQSIVNYCALIILNTHRTKVCKYTKVRKHMVHLDLSLKHARKNGFSRLPEIKFRNQIKSSEAHMCIL